MSTLNFEKQIYNNNQKSRRTNEQFVQTYHNLIGFRKINLTEEYFFIFSTTSMQSLISFSVKLEFKNLLFSILFSLLNLDDVDILVRLSRVRG